MKGTVSRALFTFLSASLWVAAAGRISAATREYTITYTDLTPTGVLGGELNFTTGTQRGGSIFGYASYATIWTGPAHSMVNLQPANWDYSAVLAGVGNQQVGWTYSVSLWTSHAAVWNGTASSYRNLNPSWSVNSTAFATTGTRQAGYATTSNYQGRAVLWSGTASSVVDLHPADGGSSIAWAIAGDQQGGMVNYYGIAHAALWSGTAASYRNLHPVGGQEHSEIRAMTTGQQVGYAGAHAGIWFGTAESFVDIHPAGAAFSEARSTAGTMQAGFAVFNSYGHALLWFGSATNYVDLHPALGAQYRDSRAHSVWTDGSTILVAGMALDWPGAPHAILWSIPVPCTITCPTNLVVCADPGQCGAVVHYTAPLTANCAGSNIVECVPPTGSFFPVGTNLVTCVVKDSNAQVEDTCTFQVVVRDCEPPVVRRLASVPDVLWPPNRQMQPVTLRVLASDNCGLTRCRILSVSNSESTDGGGDTAPDWEITGDLTLNLRAERAGNETDRVYTVTIECVDASGNRSTAVARVTVPHAMPNPPLTIRPAGPQLVVSWPTNYAGFTLESSHDWTSTAWTDCANPPVIVSGQCWVTNSLSPGARFFRLRK